MRSRPSWRSRCAARTAAWPRRSSRRSSSASPCCASARSCPTAARATPRRPWSAATRSICAPANMTTAGWARSSSTCTRKARRCARSSTTSPSRSRSACNTACRSRNMSTPSPSPASSRTARCRATTPSRYATSILDYVFRELAVSYHGALRPRPCRSERDAASTRSARAWRKASRSPRPTTSRKGLTRSRTDRLSVVSGGSAPASDARVGGGNVTALASDRRHRAQSRAGGQALARATARACTTRSGRPPARQGGGLREARRGPRQGLRGRGLRRMRQLHAGAQRHLHEVRYVRVNDGVFVTVRPTFGITKVGRTIAGVEDAGRLSRGRPSLLLLLERRPAARAAPHSRQGRRPGRQNLAGARRFRLRTVTASIPPN